MKALPAGIAAVIVAVLLSTVIVQFGNDAGDDREDYLYAIYTDAESNLNVIDVYESHTENGKATELTQRYRTSAAPSGINPFWAFHRTTGKGPFGSFYAAVNLMEGPDYDADDSVQKRRNASAGTAFACAGYDIALANQYRGARLAYLMSDDAF